MKSNAYANENYVQFVILNSNIPSISNSSTTKKNRNNTFMYVCRTCYDTYVIQI